MQRKQLLRATAVAVVAGVVGAAFLWRSAVFAPTIAVSPALMTDPQYRRHAQREYRRYRMAPVQQFGSAGEVRAVLRPLVSGAARQQDVDELVGFVSEFIWYRYCQDSVEEYKTWRRQRGYRLVDEEFLGGPELVASMYQSVFQETYPGAERLEEVFDSYWKVGPDHAGAHKVPGSGRATGIGIEPSVVDIAFGSVARENPGSYPVLAGGLGELWYGRAQTTLRPWWLPAAGRRHEVLRRQSPLEVGVVGVLMQYATGDLRPAVFGFWRDPVTRRWYLDWVTNNNTDGFISGTEY